jgi:hypothetical protein
MNESVLAGFNQSADESERRRLRSIAAEYKPNPGYDRLLAMSATELEALHLSPIERISLGHYAEAKAAHERMNR